MSETYPADTADVLTRAANHIERNGKAEGMFFRRWNAEGEETPLNQCRACTWGAISYIKTGDYVPDRTVTSGSIDPYLHALASFLGFVGLPDAGDGYGVDAWSDIHSKEEVVAGLRLAAEHYDPMNA